ncbi:hypothetical protein MSAN_01829200 [Mycena sanguinolenta]|uniref:Uncharacterized protein n=1 Tax=Mycena sanguinolenta TaxID=230812 RepID=A0A8H7CRX6_9AGAR|nr:hypothetical protein MSAN_01829200 [Mycena sanguinolenta]
MPARFPTTRPTNTTTTVTCPVLLCGTRRVSALCSNVMCKHDCRGNSGCEFTLYKLHLLLFLLPPPLLLLPPLTLSLLRPPPPRFPHAAARKPLFSVLDDMLCSRDFPHGDNHHSALSTSPSSCVYVGIQYSVV